VQGPPPYLFAKQESSIKKRCHGTASKHLPSNALRGCASIAIFYSAPAEPPAYWKAALFQATGIASQTSIGARPSIIQSVRPPQDMLNSMYSTKQIDICTLLDNDNRLSSANEAAGTSRTPVTVRSVDGLPFRCMQGNHLVSKRSFLETHLVPIIIQLWCNG
jgi:hypothetical protein